MILTKEQQEVYDEIINSTDRVIVLLGKAGTGKSTLISYLAHHYKGSVSLTATTNKAKNILYDNTGIEVNTIHSFLGYRMVTVGIDKFLSKQSNGYYDDFVVVDEISMLSQELLNSLLATPTKKILLVGDMAQLPPVGVIKANLTPYKVLYLTKIIRQNDKEVEAYLEHLRKCIDDKLIFKLEENLPSNIHIYTSHKKFCETYLDSTNSKRILAYSNRVVDSYNTNLNNGEKFKVGDYVVLDAPLGDFRNGDIVKITDLTEQENRYIMEFNECIKGYVYKSKIYLNQEIDKDISYYKSIMDNIVNPKLIYASTIHKAQGDTLDEVFIDHTDIYAQLLRKPTKFNNYNKPILVQEYLKLLYVAISRMKYKAHIFIGKERIYKYLRG